LVRRPVGEDGLPAKRVRLYRPGKVCGDSLGNLYIADTGNRCIRKIDPDGLISTIAGTGLPGYSGDGGPASEALLDKPYGICLDEGGVLYIADHNNSRIRRVGLDGRIDNVAGTYDRSYWGDHGPATEAALNAPNDVWHDHKGNLYITEARNNSFRRVDAYGIIQTLVGIGFASRYAELDTPPDCSRASHVCLHFPVGLWSDDRGALYVAERERQLGQRIPTDIEFCTRSVELPPPVFHLGPNRPNPFTVTTVFSYDAPEAARVTLDIITLDGKEVTRIVDTAVAPGCRTLIWNGQDDVGDPLPSGEYQCLMQTSTGFTQSRRLRIIRSDSTIQEV